MEKNVKEQAEEAILKAFIFMENYKWMINSYVAVSFMYDYSIQLCLLISVKVLPHSTFLLPLTLGD